MFAEFKKVRDLEPNDIMIGESCGESRVYETYPTPFSPGCVGIITEHGKMVMDLELKVIIKAKTRE